MVITVGAYRRAQRLTQHPDHVGGHAFPATRRRPCAALFLRACALWRHAYHMTGRVSLGICIALYGLHACLGHVHLDVCMLAGVQGPWGPTSTQADMLHVHLPRPSV